MEKENIEVLLEIVLLLKSTSKVPKGIIV